MAIKNINLSLASYTPSNKKFCLEYTGKNLLQHQLEPMFQKTMVNLHCHSKVQVAHSRFQDAQQLASSNYAGSKNLSTRKKIGCHLGQHPSYSEETTVQ